MAFGGFVYIVLGIAAVAGTVIFLKIRDRGWRRVGFAVFGVCLFALLFLPIILAGNLQ